MNELDFNDHAARLLSGIDLHELAGALGIAPDPRNGRFFCPDCQRGGGKDGDLAVNDAGDKMRWCCFKCGRHGDAADLVDLAQGGGPSEAWKWITARYDRSSTRPTVRETTTTPPAKPRPPLSPRCPSSDRPTATPGEYDAIFSDYLHRLKPPAGTATADYWAARGVALAALEVMGVRHIEPAPWPDGQTAIHSAMAKDHGADALVAAKLSKTGKTPLAARYEQYRIPCCAIPHLVDGKVNAIKYRPLLSKAETEKLGLPRFLVSGPMSHIYNSDAIEGAQEVFIAEGESDTLRLLSEGVTACGVPGKAWRPEWAALFRGVPRAIIATDPDSAGQEAAAAIVQSLSGIVSHLFHIRSPHGDVCETLAHLAGQKGGVPVA